MATRSRASPREGSRQTQADAPQRAISAYSGGAEFIERPSSHGGTDY
ncbi:hypothetical protein Slin14017_G126660 [Septoria linicola]|nr:hypothetical protein Slin14017_G126660 [Septoria linicola]